MRDVIDIIFDYRRLLAEKRRASTLSPAKEEQLVGLERLLITSETDSGWRSHDRVVANLSATIEVDGERHDVRLVNMSGGGVCIAPAPLLRQGERATFMFKAVATSTSWAS